MVSSQGIHNHEREERCIQPIVTQMNGTTHDS